ncbi:hypothetical protein [Nannocystis pusilla]|uniref:hypothetical protein n=1 Tax=Nannocystis pusilla TaxID=889268 RepID=UPI003B78F591
MIKLSRAVDQWSASIAVFGQTEAALAVWGVVDQAVDHNMYRNRESEHGFEPPGEFVVNIDETGELSVFRGELFLGAVRGDIVIEEEFDALPRALVVDRFSTAMDAAAKMVHAALKHRNIAYHDTSEIGHALRCTWAETVARVAISARRFSAGGSLILTSSAVKDLLAPKYEFDYPRLGDALILHCMEKTALDYARWRYLLGADNPAVTRREISEQRHLEADAEDRAREIAGAVKLIASLTTVDGAVLLDPFLRVRAFGVKIQNVRPVHRVVDGVHWAVKGRGSATSIRHGMGLDTIPCCRTVNATLARSGSSSPRTDTCA